MSLLQLAHVTKAYSIKQVLKDISLDVPPGTVVGLLGPNGAGKTTLIRIITRITLPDSGSISFRGEPLREVHQRHMGYMPEERGLYPKMKVGEQLRYLMQLRGMTAHDAATTIDHWLERLGLGEWKNRKLDELSKGMQQKAQFIATAAHKPPLLILDEPFSGLDPLNSQTLEQIIKELGQHGTTVLFSTHRMEQVEEFCQRIALLHEGELVLDDEVRAARRRYRQPVYEVECDQPITDWHLPTGAVLEHHTETTAHVRLQAEDQARLWLSTLNHHHAVVRFEMHLPTLREIFLQVVGMHQPVPEAPVTA